MLMIRIFQISSILFIFHFHSTLSDTSIFEESPGSLVVSSVNDQIQSAIGEFEIPWPGFIGFNRTKKPPLYGVTYYPWRTKMDCTNLTLSEIESDIRMIAEIAGSIYISELYCNFGPSLINLTRHYQMSILIGLSAINKEEFNGQRLILENIFLHSKLNLSHVVGVTVGHSDLEKIINLPNVLTEFQNKLKNITDIVNLSSYPNIPVTIADSIDYLFRRGMFKFEEIFIGTLNTMEFKNDPFSAAVFLYEGVLQIRNMAQQQDSDSTKKPIILMDIGWASKGEYTFIPRDKKLGRFPPNATLITVKPEHQKTFLYLLRCPRYPLPAMYYIHSAFDLTWKYLDNTNNSANAYWGLADAVTRKWKPGILSALITEPCITEGPTPMFIDTSDQGKKITSPLIIIAFVALAVLFILMLALVLFFWRWKRDAVRKLKMTRQQQLELMRNISNASAGATGGEHEQSRYLKQVSKPYPVWDDYLRMLEPEYEDLSYLVAPELRIDLSRLELHEIIGEGHFGIVQRAIYNENEVKSDVAVKRLHVGGRNVHQFLQEGIKMQKFNHPNVLNLVGISFTSTNMPLIITPYLHGGDVLDYVRKPENKNLPLGQLMNFCAQISEGMRYLHELKMVHRDLAARNCMLDKNLVVKIADFGLCRDISDNDSYQTTKSFELPIRWMPPEAIEKLQWNSKSDVWSYGVVMWELVTHGKQPYSNVPLIELRTYLKNASRLEKPDGCPDLIYEIMKSCWSSDEGSRPSFSDLCKCLPVVVEALDKAANLDMVHYYNVVIPIITAQSHTSNTDGASSSPTNDEDWKPVKTSLTLFRRRRRSTRKQSKPEIVNTAASIEKGTRRRSSVS